MKLTPYLKLSRHNVYYFRRRVPKALKKHLPYNEITQSLGTSDHKVARLMARLLLAESERLFLKIKMTFKDDKKPKSPDLMQIVEAKKIQLTHQIELDEKDEEILDLQIALNRERRLRSSQFQKIDAPLSLISENSPQLGKSSLTLGAAIEDFLSPVQIDRRKDKPATVRKNKDSLILFAEIIGRERLMSEIGQADAAFFAETIADYKMPSGFKRSPNTINGYISSINKFSKWVRGFRSEAKHPVIEWESLRAKKQTRASEERDLVTDEQAVKIFTSEKFLDKKESDKAVYWCINIAAYSGLRLEEIAQLNPTKDIFSDNGIYFFNVTESNGEQTLKTDAAKRRVPMHPKLRELGFLDYVSDLNMAKATVLFPSERVRDGRKGKNVGKRAGRLMENVLNTSGITLHSFRHTVATKFKNAQVDELIAAAILGHSVTGMTYGRYGKGYEIGLLNEAIQKLCYPC